MLRCRLQPLAIAALLLAPACGDEGGAGSADAVGADADVMPPPPDGGADDAAPGGDASADGAGDADPEVVSCQPGTTRCGGPLTLETCSASGDAWQPAECGENMGCVDGECVEQTCTPGKSTQECLDDDSYRACNASGTAMETVTCEGSSYCRKGSCIEALCEKGTVICKNFGELQRCEENPETGKLHWADHEECPPGGACFDGECLSPCEVNIKDGSYLGCEYWALDLDNIKEAAEKPMGIAVSVPSFTTSTNVQVFHPQSGQPLTPSQLGLEGPNANTKVESGDVKVFELPNGFDIDGTLQSTNLAFRIETQSPVSIHQFNPLNGEDVFTNDASLLMPSKVTGRRYFVMAWRHRQDSQQTLRGYATVVGTQKEGTTEVRVTPSVPVNAGGQVDQLAPDQQHVFELGRGEVLNLESDAEHGGDLTGTEIVGSDKITVLAGHECANVPLGIDNCDHLEQQLFSVATWGNEYVADPFQPRSPSQVDIWRVMAGENEVTVQTQPPIEGYEEFTLQRGQWIEFPSDESFRLKADGPILVGHYLTGSTYPGSQIVCDPEPGSGDQGSAIGDPAFSLATPAKRYLSEYAVLTPEGYKENYLNMVVRDGASVKLDGEVVEASPENVPDTPYGLIRVEVEPGIHTVRSERAFGLTAYGYDCDVSYAYPGGLQLQPFDKEF